MHAANSPVLVWLRNDLRVHDHEPLTAAVRYAGEHGAAIAVVYCIDPRQYRRLPMGIPKTGAHRTRFLLESLHALRHRCREAGGDLVVRVGEPEAVLPALVREIGACRLYFHGEPATEERDVERRVVEALEAVGVSAHALVGHTMVDARDLPFALADLPDVFSAYRRRVESQPVRAPLEAPARWRAAPLPPGDIPTAESLGVAPAVQHPRALFTPRGGEAEGRARLDHWVWERHGLATYKQTRNGLLTVDDSSKLSPWLALGCLSPRAVHAEVSRYEAEHGRTDDSQWMLFELHWRDYFRWLVSFAGTRLFAAGGLNGLPFPWRSLGDAAAADDFARWTRGETGFPLVDAAMRELMATGYTSNRARQNAASFLARVLGVDWRAGAAWFESQLVDYDVGSNWGNWAYVSGVGTDARGFRFFNVVKQALDYDPAGHFARHWLPELEGVPDGRIYQLSTLTAAERQAFGLTLGERYPEPMVDMHAAAEANGRRYAEAVAASRSASISSRRGSTPRLAKRKA